MRNFIRNRLRVRFMLIPLLFLFLAGFYAIDFYFYHFLHTFSKELANNRQWALLLFCIFNGFYLMRFHPGQNRRYGDWLAILWK